MSARCLYILSFLLVAFNTFYSSQQADSQVNDDRLLLNGWHLSTGKTLDQGEPLFIWVDPLDISQIGEAVTNRIGKGVVWMGPLIEVRHVGERVIIDPSTYHQYDHTQRSPGKPLKELPASAVVLDEQRLNQGRYTWHSIFYEQGKYQLRMIYQYQIISSQKQPKSKPTGDKWMSIYSSTLAIEVGGPSRYAKHIKMTWHNLRTNYIADPTLRSKLMIEVLHTPHQTPQPLYQWLIMRSLLYDQDWWIKMVRDRIPNDDRKMLMDMALSEMQHAPALSLPYGDSATMAATLAITNWEVDQQHRSRGAAKWIKRVPQHWSESSDRIRQALHHPGFLDKVHSISPNRWILQQLNVAIIKYKIDHSGAYPASLDIVVHDYPPKPALPPKWKNKVRYIGGKAANMAKNTDVVLWSIQPKAGRYGAYTASGEWRWLSDSQYKAIENSN